VASNRKRRKGQDEEGHVSSERWLVTYADMITLLMAFFIMMYAMSIVSMGKFAELALSVRSGFGGDVAKMNTAVLALGGSTRPHPGIFNANRFELLDKIEGQLKRTLKEKGFAKLVTVERTEQGIAVRLPTDELLFDLGSAELRPTTRRLLAVLAPTLRQAGFPIRVEGHTCDLPIHSALFPSNWELSARRATNVLTFLTHRCGLSPDRVAAVGYGDTKPLVPNDTEAHRRLNRRVEIVVLVPSEREVAALPTIIASGSGGTTAAHYFSYLGSAAYELAEKIIEGRAGRSSQANDHLSSTSGDRRRRGSGAHAVAAEARGGNGGRGGGGDGDDHTGRVPGESR